MQQGIVHDMNIIQWWEESCGSQIPIEDRLEVSGARCKALIFHVQRCTTIELWQYHVEGRLVSGCSSIHWKTAFSARAFAAAYEVMVRDGSYGGGARDALIADSLSMSVITVICVFGGTKAADAVVEQKTKQGIVGEWLAQSKALRAKAFVGMMKSSGVVLAPS